MLGQPVSMLIPKVVGFKLSGAIPTGVTATDVVLTITDMLRKHGVVGKFVEFYGSGVASVPLANRATIGNMSPEFGSTAAMFPIDDVTIDYLRLTGRSEEQLALVEAVREAAEALARRRPTSRRSPSTSSSTSPRSCPRSPARSARRTASCSRTRRRSSSPTSRTTPRSTTTSSTSRAPSPSPPPTRPATRPRTSTASTCTTTTATRPKTASKPTKVDLADGTVVHARPRRRHDRRDHVVHEHVEPVGHARRRPARPQRGEEGPQGQAVGEDHPRAGLEGRHRLLREGRPHAGPRGPRLLHGRLRLHHLHRQLRAR